MCLIDFVERTGQRKCGQTGENSRSGVGSFKKSNAHVVFYIQITKLISSFKINSAQKHTMENSHRFCLINQEKKNLYA